VLNRAPCATSKAMTTAQNSIIKNIPPVIGASGMGRHTLTPPMDEIECGNFASLPNRCVRPLHAIRCFQQIFTSHQFNG
jgi:hypothetical protein